MLKVALAFLLISTSVVYASPALRFVPGETYLPEAISLIDSATRNIDILQFNFFAESGAMRSLANHLIQIKRAHPGLRIRVLLEGEKDLGQAQGTATRNRLTQALLAREGIDVTLVTGLRDGHANGVSHAKALAVDGRFLLAGSSNWTNTSVGKNNEMNNWVDSVAITGAFTQFYDRLIVDSSVMHPLQIQDGSVTLLSDTAYYEQLLKLIRQASSGDHLDFSMYFFAYRSEADVQAKQVFDELTQAQARGAHIRAFLERNGNPRIAPEVTQTNLKVAALLNEAGIQEVYLDPLEKISHTKMIILNRKTALLGSSNWYRGDFNENHQIDWLVSDPEQVERLSAYFDQKILSEGTLYHP